MRGFLCCMGKTGRIVCAFSFVFSLSIPAKAITLDAPHNEENQVTCASCHEFSLNPPYTGWKKYGFEGNGASETTIINFICLRCHGAGKSSAPTMGIHSSLSTKSSYSNWTTKCTDCHDPHAQAQLQWADAESIFLVSGTIESKEIIDYPLRSTTLFVSNVNVTPGWETSILWTAKTTQGRGLILVTLPDVDQSNTYEIVGATYDPATATGTIQVTGQLMEEPGTTFGAMYGQFIKNRITYQRGQAHIDSPVRFFEPFGFIEPASSSAPSSPTAGICQVCHTRTKRFTANGILPASAKAYGGCAPDDCTDCHMAARGFKADGHGDGNFSFDGNCITCHDNDNNPATKPPVVRFVHGNKCAMCHANSDKNDFTRRTGDPSHGVDGDARLALNRTATCSSCHPGASVKSGTAAIHHDSRNGYADRGECMECHVSPFFPANHVPTVANHASCVTCHATAAGTPSGMAIDPLDTKVHSNCLQCHKTDGKRHAPYGTAIAMPPGGGNCTTCHGAYFSNHARADHAGSVVESSGCAGCHPNTAGIATGIAVSEADNRIHDACATCHGVTGALKAPYGKAIAMPVGGGNCTACHGEYCGAHGNDRHERSGSMALNCVVCHAEIADGNPPAISQ